MLPAQLARESPQKNILRPFRKNWQLKRHHGRLQVKKMSSQPACGFCGAAEKLQRCGQCKLVLYCSKEHQKSDWKRHKNECRRSCAQSPRESAEKANKSVEIKQKRSSCQERTVGGCRESVPEPESEPGSASVNHGSSDRQKTIQNKLDSSKTAVGSGNTRNISENGEDTAKTKQDLQSTAINLQNLTNTSQDSRSDCQKPTQPRSDSQKTIQIRSDSQKTHENRSNLQNISRNESDMSIFPNISLETLKLSDIMEQMCVNVVKDMDKYGVCVLDDFMGEEKGRLVLQEVLKMHTRGVFRDGQLVSSTGRQNDLKTIRGDQIAWIDGNENYCKNIGHLITQVDSLIMRANKMMDNGKLGSYNINGRTKVKNTYKTKKF